ncbi:MAG: CotH kinase family protein, partial [Treponema sp.]|nr:CotH kinase family protein [Treponema sp.]
PNNMGGGYRNYIDIDSVIDWYLVNEIGKNNDADFHSSVYLCFDPVMHKFRMGPVWDFDIAFGNIDYTECQYPSGLWVNKSLWFSRFFEDALFKKQLKERWNEKKPELETIFYFIDKRASYLDTPQKYNFKKWKIMNKKVWPNPQSAGNYRGEVDYLKTWLRERIDWLDAEFNSY